MEILLILPGFIFLILTIIVVTIEYKTLSNSPKIRKNKVHFYVTKDKIGNLILWLGKPYRRGDAWEGGRTKALLLAASYTSKSFDFYKLKISDYDDLKWEDEPLEVFVNMED